MQIIHKGKIVPMSLIKAVSHTLLHTPETEEDISIKFRLLNTTKIVEVTKISLPWTYRKKVTQFEEAKSTLYLIRRTKVKIM